MCRERVCKTSSRLTVEKSRTTGLEPLYIWDLVRHYFSLPNYINQIWLITNSGLLSKNSYNERRWTHFSPEVFAPSSPDRYPIHGQSQTVSTEEFTIFLLLVVNLLCRLPKGDISVNPSSLSPLGFLCNFYCSNSNTKLLNPLINLGSRFKE